MMNLQDTLTENNLMICNSKLSNTDGAGCGIGLLVDEFGPTVVLLHKAHVQVVKKRVMM